VRAHVRTHGAWAFAPDAKSASYLAAKFKIFRAQVWACISGAWRGLNVEVSDIFSLYRRQCRGPRMPRRFPDRARSPWLGPQWHGPARLLSDRHAARAGKQSTRAPVGSAGVVGTARRKGGSGNRGRPVTRRVAASTSRIGGGHGGSRTGSYERRSRVMPAEQSALPSGVPSRMVRGW
jgi:hypothetical protein